MGNIVKMLYQIKKETLINTFVYLYSELPFCFCVSFYVNTPEQIF